MLRKYQGLLRRFNSNRTSLKTSSRHPNRTSLKTSYTQTQDACSASQHAHDVAASFNKPAQTIVPGFPLGGIVGTPMPVLNGASSAFCARRLLPLSVWSWFLPYSDRPVFAGYSLCEYGLQDWAAHKGPPGLSWRPWCEWMGASFHK